MAFCVETGSLFQVLALVLATRRSYALHFDFTIANSGPSVLLVHLVCDLLFFSVRDLLYAYNLKCM